MSILLSNIYNKAIALFDDPKITVAFETDKIQYEKLMYVYLQNALGMFSNPTSIAVKLNNGFIEPKGTMEIFEGDGQTQEFELSEEFEIIKNSKYSFIEGDKKVTGKIIKKVKEIPLDNSIDNSDFNIKEVNVVQFPDILPKGQQYAVEQYYCGEFNVNFTELNNNANNQANMISQQVQGILARLLILAWAEDQRNNYVEVHNILTDTDFKLSSVSAHLNASNNWIRQLDMEVNEWQTKLGWMIRFGLSNSYIGRG